VDHDGLIDGDHHRPPRERTHICARQPCATTRGVDQLLLVVATDAHQIRTTRDQVDDRLRVGTLADEIADEDHKIVRIDGERIQQRAQPRVAAMDVPHDGDGGPVIRSVVRVWDVWDLVGDHVDYCWTAGT
jgi:hypothetical protein